MTTDRDLLFNTREQLRSNPQTLGIRVSSDHYLWIAGYIETLQCALDKSVKLQSHYASTLNLGDGGKRLQFRSSEDWISRLQSLDALDTL